MATVTPQASGRNVTSSQGMRSAAASILRSQRSDPSLKVLQHDCLRLARSGARVGHEASGAVVCRGSRRQWCRRRAPCTSLFPLAPPLLPAHIRRAHSSRMLRDDSVSTVEDRKEDERNGDGDTP